MRRLPSSPGKWALPPCRVQPRRGRLLDRQAEPAGLNGWLNYLGQGHTLADVERQILGSEEYFQTRAGAPLEGFLAAVCSDILCRRPDAVGQSSWLLLLNAGLSRTDATAMILNSAESDSRRFLADYQAYLHRQADPGGLFDFTQSLENGTPDEVVVAGIVGSDEYFTRFQL